MFVFLSGSTLAGPRATGRLRGRTMSTARRGTTGRAGTRRESTPGMSTPAVGQSAAGQHERFVLEIVHSILGLSLNRTRISVLNIHCAY